MSVKGRFILHADLDAFYASVEQLDNPELRGKPVVVGGSPESRGVVAAASYEARKFGVRSAMSMSRALRLCPKAPRISPRFDRYREVSQEVMSIFRSVTPLVEPLSLDEAYLDVSETAGTIEAAADIAQSIKAEVKDKTGLTVSVGVGTSKSVAKIASDMDKPDGFTIVEPGTERAFLEPLPARRLSGVGPKAEAALLQSGIKTIGDLASADIGMIEQLIGSRASSLVRTAQGIDEGTLTTHQERKSVSSETTFATDLGLGTELEKAIKQLSEEVGGYLQSKGMKARTVTLKLRFSNFKTVTRQMAVVPAVESAEGVLEAAMTLLDKLESDERRFRLVGVKCSNWADENPVQPMLLGPDGD